jgi:hypothetical protein
MVPLVVCHVIDSRICVVEEETRTGLCSNIIPQIRNGSCAYAFSTQCGAMLLDVTPRCYFHQLQCAAQLATTLFLEDDPMIMDY